MATYNFIAHPIVNTDSISSAYCDWYPDSLLRSTPGDQDQAGYFGQSWQIDAAWDSTNNISLPVGSTTSYLRPCEDADADAHELQRKPPLKLSPIATESLASYDPDTRLSPPTMPAEKCHTVPSTLAKRPNRCGRPAHLSMRESHNEIEARYRETVNAAIKNLRQVVPPLFHRDGTTFDDRKRPYSKAAVMIGAVAYIKHLEAEHGRLVEENKVLRTIAVHQPLPN